MVSDHGFERVNKIVNLQSVVPNVVQTSGVAMAPDEIAAKALRELAKDSEFLSKILQAGSHACWE